MTFKAVVRLFVEGLTMFIVAAASLFLLLYVGFGDGKRTYEAMQVEKLSAQGLYVQNSMEKYLRDGVPLKQFAGFQSLAAPLLEGDDIDALLVFDQRGRQVFSAIDKGKPKLPVPPAGLDHTSEATKVHYDPTHYQIVLPLRSRFETLGSIVVVAPNSKVLERLYVSFLPLVFLAIGLSLVFAIGAVLITARLSNSKKPWLQIAYGITFLTMAVVVVGTLIGLYFNGVEGKAKASAFTLSQRLSDIVEFKLKFNHFEGIDKAFTEYLKLNPEIREAALLLDNKVEITTDAPHGGKKWLADSGNFEYRVDLTPPEQPNYTTMIVTVPKQVAYERVARSVKNFAALFIASAFLSGIFLQVASSLQKLRRAPAPTDAKAANDDGLIIVKPVYMLAVLLDALTYSFLPKFLQDAALASGVSLGFASVPFTAYYIGFAASLIPAGVLCDRQGPKPMIIGGMILAAGSVFAMAMPFGIWELTGLRLLAGIGQGILIIGVQSFILAVASPEKKTQGAAIIVFGFQAGLIAGMALGSLMVNFLGPKGVFFISGAIGAANIVYSQLLIAKTEKKAQITTLQAAFAKLSGDLRKVITSLEFLRTLTCIGMPAKAILTGIITFALPLILGQAGYRPEDIGQVVMLYGLGVLLSSGYASRYVDRTKNSEAILFIGAIVSGAGLLLVGMMGTPWLGNGVVSTVVVVFAVGIVGIAHGFINAPVVTHVGQTALASRIGTNSATTAYRFLERGGHIAGPLLMSQLFIFFGQGPSVIGGVGIAVAVLGVLFVIYRILPQPARLQGEPAE
jgi:MFS family permease